MLLGVVLFVQRRAERLASKSKGKAFGGRKTMRLQKQRKLTLVPTSKLAQAQAQASTARKYTVPKVGWNPTLSFYLSVYGRFLVLSVGGIAYAFDLYLRQAPERFALLLEAIIFGIPPTIISIFTELNHFIKINARLSISSPSKYNGFFIHFPCSSIN